MARSGPRAKQAWWDTRAETGSQAWWGAALGVLLVLVVEVDQREETRRQ